MMNNNIFVVFEEDFDTSLHFKNEIKLSPSKMERFFVENPELKNKMKFDQENDLKNNEKLNYN